MLIPAWQPDAALLHLVTALRGSSFAAIVVVDDGSAPPSQAVFSALRGEGISVLRHAVNLGKGRALKTGFNALLVEHPEVRGVITADADGQHTPEDIVKVAAALAANLKRPMLGTRAFAGSVPLGSRIGNTFTRALFGIVSGVHLQDTQTGLRGLPVSTLPALLALRGERYEYEMNMLAHLCRIGERPLEVPIKTIYLDGNRSSHFHPLWDSVRVCLALARFVRASVGE